MYELFHGRPLYKTAHVTIDLPCCFHVCNLVCRTFFSGEMITLHHAVDGSSPQCAGIYLGSTLCFLHKPRHDRVFYLLRKDRDRILLLPLEEFPHRTVL